MTKKFKKQFPSIKKFEDLTYADSFLFGEVMLDETTSKNVLEIILGLEIEKVVIIEKEKQITHTPDSKSIRLDIYVQDEKNTVYNIEMQVENKKDIPKRSRYYQGLLDVKNLPSGATNYNQLHASYVIFICQFDPFGYGKCCYTFEETCLEEPTLSLGDGAKKIFLNTTGTNRTEMSEDLREFLDYVKNPVTINLNSKKVKAIDNRVNKVKADAEVRSRYMTLANWIEEQCDLAKEFAREEGFAEGQAKGIAEGRAKGREEGRAEGRAEGIEEGRAEGIEEGRTKGREEGRAEGEAKGLQEGKIESKVELIHTKYRKGLDVSVTAEMLDLEKDFIEHIYQLFQTYPEDSDKKITRRYLQ